MSIVLASTPRSGSTWCRLLLADALGFDEIPVHHPAELEGGKIPEDAVVQIHWPSEPEFLAVVEAADTVLVTLLRHPLDVLAASSGRSCLDP